MHFTSIEPSLMYASPYCYMAVTVLTFILKYLHDLSS